MSILTKKVNTDVFSLLAKFFIGLGLIYFGSICIFNGIKDATNFNEYIKFNKIFTVVMLLIILFGILFIIKTLRNFNNKRKGLVVTKNGLDTTTAVVGKTAGISFLIMLIFGILMVAWILMIR